MSDLVNEVNNERKRNNFPRLDVSDIVKQHIQTGAEWEEMSASLIQDGFKCYKRSAPIGESAKENYDCIFNLRRWYQLSFGAQLRINVMVSNGKVLAARGALIYLGI